MYYGHQTPGLDAPPTEGWAVVRPDIGESIGTNPPPAVRLEFDTVKGARAFARPPREEPPPLPSVPAATPLVLVAKDSSARLVFEHAARLRAHEEAPLTLLSHPGCAVVPTKSVPDGPYCVGSGMWLVIPVGVGAVTANQTEDAAVKAGQKDDAALKAVLDADGFVTRTHDARVFEIAWWKLEEGNTVSLINDMYCDTKTRTKGAGRSFVFNDDGTISPAQAPHLALGTITNALRTS